MRPLGPKAWIFGLVSLVIVVGGAALAALLFSGGEDGQRVEGRPYPEFAEVMSVFAEEEAGAPPGILAESRRLRLDSLREVGSQDGVTYFLAVNKEDQVCLTLYVEERDVAASGCSTIEVLGRYGGAAGFKSPEYDVSAFLIPDGYKKAASQLTWAELLGQNVLVIEQAPPRGEIQLAPDDREDEMLVLQPSIERLE